MGDNDCKNISLCIALTKEQSQLIRTLLSVLHLYYWFFDRCYSLIFFILGQENIKSIYKLKKQIYHVFH